MKTDEPAAAGPLSGRVRERSSPATPAPAGVRAAEDRLMARIGAGDRDAARELMAANLSRILGLARRTLGDPVEAEDVAQETFLRVWKAAGRWQSGQARVSSWICRIALNLCYDRLRRRREIPTETVPERADSAPGQDSRMEQAETGHRVAMAVARLPDRQRQALELVHFQEMSNIEAAAIMSVSVDALESLLARGRRKLKALLLGDAPDLIASYARGGDARYGDE
ncbi:RNA polymerase sigma factor [Maricaulis sp.]|uniref:RNA polymerase sigma factor n=1 Tax=Maricaulis sp. TaxID=1486257 RepID=UPI0025C42C9D|nr:RNA polymerase sigma factor [Maricaulis sp.]